MVSCCSTVEYRRHWTRKSISRQLSSLLLVSQCLFTFPSSTRSGLQVSLCLLKKTLDSRASLLEVSIRLFVQAIFSVIFGGERGELVVHVIVQYFSSPPKCHSFFATRRKSVVENDRVRPGLVELQSLSLSALQIDPIHRVLMYLPLLPISSNSCLCQVKLRLPVFPYVQGIYCCKEHCLPPFLCVSSICDQTWSCEGVQVGRVSNVVEVLSKVIW